MDVIKTEIDINVRGMYPELSVKNGTKVFIVQTADEVLIEFDVDDGKAILPVSLSSENGEVTGIKRAD